MAYVENIYAPEVFVSGAVGINRRDGNAHITFATRRSSYPSAGVVESADVVSLRVILPLAALRQMVAELTAVLEEEERPQTPPPGAQSH